MSYNFESEVPEALGQLLKTEEDYNVIIHIGEEPNFKEFHAHSNILRCRSEYFSKIISSENIERKDGKYIIKKPNISPQAFEIILKYLYTGQFNIANKAGTELLDFMIISDEMMLKKLTNLTEDFIVKNQQIFLQNDPVGILQIVYYCKPLVNLQEFCLEKICSKPEILFKSDKYIQLPVPLLEIILKRDDLNLKEIEIWENLIKWGLAQEKTLNQDVSQWSKDDINILKRILYKFIPLIRFFEISTEDYYNKVKPYEKILSKELRDDILKFYMLPGYKPIYTPRQPKYPKLIIESTIINSNHAALFPNWINRKVEEHIIKDIPYEFKLLYRASRDGNSAASFHTKCDNKGASIVVIKISNSKQIVGGYNPLFWDTSESCKSTKDSFIFSFADKNNLKSANLVYSKGDPYSIQCYKVNGPVFGIDLYTEYNPTADTWMSKVYSYPSLDLPNTFKIDDYEVFQVIKK
ncbi:hypothetical protein C1646_759488 [Rhizophagus diaphanus]|nr:hypothetical protein C1646_759488 [Rhizophagus diaphanus] [Rhizophagus sp. MUCL 43196]